MIAYEVSKNCSQKRDWNSRTIYTLFKIHSQQEITNFQDHPIWKVPHYHFPPCWAAKSEPTNKAKYLTTRFKLAIMEFHNLNLVDCWSMQALVAWHFWASEEGTIRETTQLSLTSLLCENQDNCLIAAHLNENYGKAQK